jgi:hypothetical protein
MAHPQPASWLADALAPLDCTFGEKLRFARDGAVAQWSYAGHAAIVELTGEDRIVARFVGPPEMDTVSGEPAKPVYRRYEHGYALTRAGCERMVSDMVAFFSGIREPRFIFVGAH